MKRYEFFVGVSENGEVSVRHNCDNLVEFLGVLELIKAVGIKLFNNTSSKATIDPKEYLEQVKKNTVVYNVDKTVSLGGK